MFAIFFISHFGYGLARCVFSPHSHRRKTLHQLSARHRVCCPRRQNGHDKHTRDSGSSPLQSQTFFLGEVKCFLLHKARLKRAHVVVTPNNRRVLSSCRSAPRSLQWSSEKASPKNCALHDVRNNPLRAQNISYTQFTPKRRGKCQFALCLPL